MDKKSFCDAGETVHRIIFFISIQRSLCQRLTRFGYAHARVAEMTWCLTIKYLLIHFNLGQQVKLIKIQISQIDGIR
ncbi:hypothetical protein NIES4074_50480 [Cylindrospermum sp. NIES-4074]|nr:hypothetical protein NIES4074_50480 [Cylindrospermum sp. NIES-4074]